MSSAYDGAAAPAWAAGPDRLVYEPLARELVSACGPAVAGARVLDLGAGTGAATRAARAAGARVVAVDLAVTMLAHLDGGTDLPGPPPLVAAADATRLPFRRDTFDGVLAAFVLNHLPDPAAVLTEAGRVTRPGGFVVASTFHRDWDHPAKHAVDAAAARMGFRPPDWYRALKADHAPRAGDPELLSRNAVAAGLAGVRVDRRTCTIPIPDPAELVAWRAGMAHLAPFVAELEPRSRQRLADDAAAELGTGPCLLHPEILALWGTVPGRAAYDG